MEAAPATGCCLVHCAEPATPLAESGRVEIEANPATLPDGGGGAVRWREGGGAAFHPACWESLLARLPTRRRKKPAPGATWAPSSAELPLLKEAAPTAEHHASPAAIEAAASTLVGLLKACGSKGAVVFSGAGISTAAGVGDYRGKSGKWTKEAQGREEPYLTVRLNDLTAT